MELRDYVRLLRLRWRLITTLTVLGVAAALLATYTADTVYRSRTQLIVSSTSATASLPEAVTANQYIQVRIPSYLQFITGPDVTDRARELLGGNARLGGIEASGPEGTVLIDVSVTAGTAREAQRQAAAVAQAFIDRVAVIEPSAAGGSVIRVTVVKPANLPRLPDSPRPKTNLLIGLLTGLFLGVTFALVREALDTRIASPESLESTFGVATLSVVAYDPASKSSPIVAVNDRRSTRAEAYRRLRTNLQFVDVDNPVTSIVVTSAVPGEGKTTTACNLAVMLAEAGVAVTLVEGDLRRPRLAQYLGLEGAVGVTDVLVGRAHLDDVLQPWGASGALSVLAQGPIPPNPSEILGSQHMVDLIRDLEERSFVIIDAPPLLPVTDAAVLSAHTSGALLVVKARSTRREQVASSVQSLQDVSGRLLGAVFNMAATRGPDAYSYRYGYGYYADPARAAVEPSPVAVTPAPSNVGVASHSAPTVGLPRDYAPEPAPAFEVRDTSA